MAELIEKASGTSIYYKTERALKDLMNDKSILEDRQKVLEQRYDAERELLSAQIDVLADAIAQAEALGVKLPEEVVIP